jgi:hypothetical protein
MLMRRGLSIAFVALLGIFASPASAQTSRPAYPYPNSPEGLTQFFRDALTVTANKDQRQLLARFNSLYMPEPEAWFIKTFGEKKAPPLIAEYKKNINQFHAKLALVFLNLPDPKDLMVKVSKVEDTDDPSIKAFQRLALDEMENPVTLYTVRIHRPGTTAKIEVWSIVWADGAFRMAGQMKEIRKIPQDKSPDDPS